MLQHSLLVLPMVEFCQLRMQKEAELALALTMLLRLLLQLGRPPLWISDRSWPSHSLCSCACCCNWQAPPFGSATGAAPVAVAVPVVSAVVALLVLGPAALAGEATNGAVGAAVEPVQATAGGAVSVAAIAGVVVVTSFAVAPLAVAIGGALVAVVEALSVVAVVVGYLGDAVAQTIVLVVGDAQRACGTAVASTFVRHELAAAAPVHAPLGRVDGAFAYVPHKLVVTSHLGVVAASVATSGYASPATGLASAFAVVFGIELHGFAFADMPCHGVVVFAAAVALRGVVAFAVECSCFADAAFVGIFVLAVVLRGVALAGVLRRGVAAIAVVCRRLGDAVAVPASVEQVAVHSPAPSGTGPVSEVGVWTRAAGLGWPGGGVAGQSAVEIVHWLNQ
ncbi:hypothetical protein CBR_g84836 [Chara braunii]|uniref:Uncharacterized protein n=1 Tax=Chara braunii TaxID=69332 RepID=A0A388KAT7_CHABU|nr:hypothetical protein CBR_g84836 [Chara braunii]|eukprot:GBG67172.1 hypothetical protein CBR_g84836 [Chara braunii]